jgi:dienelactone hydrolase
MHLLVALLFTLSSSLALAAPQHKEIHYSDGSTEFHGYLAWDDANKQRRPGVLVVHEWWGHNAYARHRADMLAQLGYVALAVDMYGQGENTGDPEHAGHMMKMATADPAITLKRFIAALDTLKKQPQTDKNKIAAIGYCFGGGVVLNMARAGIDLDGVVSFHGSLATSTPAVAGKTKAKVLVYNGADDSFTTPEQITAFKQEMDAAKVDYQFINLPNAKHGFSNPDATDLGSKLKMNIAYNAEADKTSWAGMQAFFKKIFAN